MIGLAILAVKKGLDAIFKRNPDVDEKTLSKHVDEKRVDDHARETYRRADERGLPDDKKREYVRKELSDYVASGAAFDKKGRKELLRSARENPRLEMVGKPETGEEYLARALYSFKQLGNLLKEEDYRRRMRDILYSVETLKDLHLLYDALDILYDADILDERKYQAIKAGLEKQVKKATKKTQKVAKKTRKKIIKKGKGLKAAA